MQDEFDIVHNHMGYQALPLLNFFNCPIVSTNHNLVADYCTDIYLAYKDLPFVAISDAYRQLNYPNELNYVSVVYNGIDIDKFKFVPNSRRDYLLFMGRVSADKGTATAIDMAIQLGFSIKIAGKIDVVDQDYFAKEVKPRLSLPGVEFLGEVNHDEKIELYSGALAVLYPITFEEPFGLVMAEALASGTPVVALNRGAVKEVISDGQTGIIADSINELINRFSEIHKISRTDCRQRACELFSKERMTREYEEVYESLAGNKTSIGELCEERL